MLQPLGQANDVEEPVGVPAAGMTFLPGGDVEADAAGLDGCRREAGTPDSSGTAPSMSGPQRTPSAGTGHLCGSERHIRRDRA